MKIERGITFEITAEIIQERAQLMFCVCEIFAQWCDDC
jgi:hypothetical protein